MQLPIFDAPQAKNNALKFSSSPKKRAFSILGADKSRKSLAAEVGWHKKEPDC